MLAQSITSSLRGRWFGSYGYVRCVAHKDGRPSLRLRDGERGRLLVYCHAGCDSSVILDRLRQARVLTASEPSTAEQQALQRAQEATEARRKQERIAEANRLWCRCSRPQDTPVSAYLTGRGIVLPIPPTIRYASALSHPDSQNLFACMVAAVQQPDRRVTGIHRTYLARDGRKAKLDSAKLSLGPIAGGAVRLAAPAEEMAVGEGIETCLSFMQLTSIPTWAGLSTSGLKGFCPPPQCKKLHILVDNDENGAGHTAADILSKRLGIACEMRESPTGKDWNDAVMNG